MPPLQVDTHDEFLIRSISVVNIRYVVDDLTVVAVITEDDKLKTVMQSKIAASEPKLIFKLRTSDALELSVALFNTVDCFFRYLLFDHELPNS